MKYTILAVDKDVRILSYIKDVFEREVQDYFVLTAENGEIAQQIAIESKPDLIILDWQMPMDGGIKTIEALKTIEETTDIPVIMLTKAKHITEVHETGAIDFIRKPIDKAEMIVRVKSTLSIFKLIKEIIKQTKTLESQSKLLEDQKRNLEKEKQKTDTLLLNILPYEIAEQLKNKGRVDAKGYKSVSALFTDFKGFTKISEQLSPEEIIKELGVYFEKFDEITGKHFLEKIKTIGDSYMCVGGLPLRNRSNPIDAVLAGLQIQKFMGDYNKIKKSLNQVVWELRLGIHTGSAVAGVIGKKKFAYDVWGDTVNTASRMESAGEAGKVNISGETYRHICDYFDCTYRGKVEAKNKGEIDMYFVDGLKPEYALNNDVTKPNAKFLEIYSSI